MADIPDLLPKSVLDEIREHLRQADDNAQESWSSANQDEDSVTGDFFGAMRRTMRPSENDRAWRWKITYTKLRGRGPKAPENIVGADGIIQAEIVKNGIVYTKGLLFQAKKVSAKRASAVEQVKKMERYAPGASAVFTYGPHRFFAEEGSSFSTERRDRASLKIGDFLATRFIECVVGSEGLVYDAHRNTLYRTAQGDVALGLAHNVRLVAIKRKPRVRRRGG
jgi:hypothetical protein